MKYSDDLFGWFSDRFIKSELSSYSFQRGLGQVQR